MTCGELTILHVSYKSRRDVAICWLLSYNIAISRTLPGCAFEIFNRFKNLAITRYPKWAELSGTELATHPYVVLQMSYALSPIVVCSRAFPPTQTTAESLWVHDELRTAFCYIVLSLCRGMADSLRHLYEYFRQLYNSVRDSAGFLLVLFEFGRDHLIAIFMGTASLSSIIYNTQLPRMNFIGSTYQK